MRWLFVLVLLPLAYSSEEGYHGHRMLSIKTETKEQMDFLASLETDPDFIDIDFWARPSLLRPATVRVSPQTFGKLQSALHGKGMSYSVIHDNVQEVVDQEAAENKRRQEQYNELPCQTRDQYCNLDQVEEITDQLAAQYPNRVEKRTIGYSWEGRPINEVRIAWDLAHAHQGVWIEATTHAREWISTAATLNLIISLATVESAAVEQMLHKYDWHIIPVHNPDGYAYSHISGNTRLWRKNRQPCPGNQIGTDLNRNWAADFGGAGSSNNCQSDVYHGAHAFSANETLALKDAIENSYHPKAYFSIHSYGEMMIVPYSYTTDEPRDKEALIEKANIMMNALREVDGTQFQVGQGSHILYAASGGSDDYMYDGQNIKWSYTYELRPRTQNQGGFVLSPDQIDVSSRELLASLVAFAGEEND